MTGKELAKALKAHKGKIQVQAMFGPDVPWLYVEKRDIVQHFKSCGDKETGCALTVNSGSDAFVGPEY